MRLFNSISTKYQLNPILVYCFILLPISYQQVSHFTITSNWQKASSTLNACNLNYEEIVTTPTWTELYYCIFHLDLNNKGETRQRDGKPLISVMLLWWGCKISPLQNLSDKSLCEKVCIGWAPGPLSPAETSLAQTLLRGSLFFYYTNINPPFMFHYQQFKVGSSMSPHHAMAMT